MTLLTSRSRGPRRPSWPPLLKDYYETALLQEKMFHPPGRWNKLLRSTAARSTAQEVERSLAQDSPVGHTSRKRPIVTESKPGECKERKSAMKAALTARLPVRPDCPDCQSALQYTNDAEGPYSEGWSCNNFESCGSSSDAGGFRWCCRKCLIDFCTKFKPRSQVRIFTHLNECYHLPEE